MSPSWPAGRRRGYAGGAPASFLGTLGPYQCTRAGVEPQALTAHTFVQDQHLALALRAAVPDPAALWRVKTLFSTVNRYRNSALALRLRPARCAIARVSLVASRPARIRRRWCLHCAWARSGRIDGPALASSHRPWLLYGAQKRFLRPMGAAARRWCWRRGCGRPDAL